MLDRSPRTIATINFKGGVGKTTVTWCLGDVLSSLSSERVLTVDLDAQMSLTQAIALNEATGSRRTLTALNIELNDLLVALGTVEGAEAGGSSVEVTAQVLVRAQRQARDTDQAVRPRRRDLLRGTEVAPVVGEQLDVGHLVGLGRHHRAATSRKIPRDVRLGIV
jgi:cellulose biosynthesis protein BcsQ